MARTRQSGYVALLAVLIVGAASIAVATSLLLTSADNQRVTLAVQRSMLARSNASACAEEGLQQIHDNTSFTGTNNLTLSSGTCSYTVSNTGGSNRTVTANSTVGTSVRRLQITLTIGVSNLTINTWQEIP